MENAPATDLIVPVNALITGKILQLATTVKRGKEGKKA